MRLNFSFSNKKDIEEGVRRLSKVIGEAIGSGK
jgi:DNA-binding transcriptional MocR family regulator